MNAPSPLAASTRLPQKAVMKNILVHFDTLSIKTAIDKASAGVERYLSIQDRLKKGVDPRDKAFQQSFNTFYKVSRRSAQWYVHFYEVFFQTREENWNFEKILLEIYKQTGTVEASFASKIRASIDEDSVVIDSVVLLNLGLRLMRGGNAERRLQAACATYATLTEIISTIQHSEVGKEILNQFRERYKALPVSDVKAIDFTLWQHRSRIPQ